MAILRTSLVISRIHVSARIFLIATFAFLLAFAARAQTASPEYKLKAVYLYNFVQYVDWPPDAFADPQSPLIIGVLGNDPFGSVLEETVKDEVVKNRRLEVHRFKNVKEIKECHVLFVSASEKDKLKSILAALKGRSILTVGDMENFAQGGGVVRLITENNKIHFRINLEAVKESRLSISSKLLQLAEIMPKQ